MLGAVLELIACWILDRIWFLHFHRKLGHTLHVLLLLRLIVTHDPEIRQILLMLVKEFERHDGPPDRAVVQGTGTAKSHNLGPRYANFVGGQSRPSGRLEYFAAAEAHAKEIYETHLRLIRQAAQPGPLPSELVALIVA